MAKKRITRELIRQLDREREAALEVERKGGDKAKVREIYDDLLTGFGVRMRVNGSISFLYRWTTPDGGQQKIAIGHPSDKIEDVRKAVKEFIERTDHKADSDPARVEKHKRRVADTNVVTMPTVGEYLDGDYRKFWIGDENQKKKKPRPDEEQTEESKWRGKTKSETPEQNLKNIRRDFAGLMDVRLDEVTHEMIVKWTQDRKSGGYEPTGINRALGALGGLFSHAISPGAKISINPCAGARIRIDAKTERARLKKFGRALSSDEERRLRVVLDAREARLREQEAQRLDARKVGPVAADHQPFADYVKPAILFALNTAMRRSEVLRARWRAVDLQARTITVESWTSKVKTERVVPLNDEALAILKAWREQTFRRHEFIFPNEIGEPQREVRDWLKIKAEAQITNFRFLDTRHHAATRMVNADVSLIHIQTILGHTDGRMTQRYVRSEEQKLHEAVAGIARDLDQTADDSAQAA